MENYEVIHSEKGLCRQGDHELIQEEPLLIRVDDKPYSVVIMGTLQRTIIRDG